MAKTILRENVLPDRSTVVVNDFVEKVEHPLYLVGCEEAQQKVFRHEIKVVEDAILELKCTKEYCLSYGIYRYMFKNICPTLTLVSAEHGGINIVAEKSAMSN